MSELTPMWYHPATYPLGLQSCRCAESAVQPQGLSRGKTLTNGTFQQKDPPLLVELEANAHPTAWHDVVGFGLLDHIRIAWRIARQAVTPVVSPVQIAVWNGGLLQEQLCLLRWPAAGSAAWQRRDCCVGPVTCAQHLQLNLLRPQVPLELVNSCQLDRRLFLCPLAPLTPNLCSSELAPELLDRGLPCLDLALHGQASHPQTLLCCEELASEFADGGLVRLRPALREPAPGPPGLQLPPQLGRLAAG
eukprot:CAMPEP_0179072076 /NCGR_PEP_ID=MMETSP0796-20121207/31866_1 /TAXON_ID=73915 /ORGANISM="Pyrodinium bahamense, Strain pbaha01" /LENGTH=247 /DNA_ID=CAMNT_0020769221 /DNA_START=398 /DNA_END=1138 /DNA_ORIENTATION=-